MNFRRSCSTVIVALLALLPVTRTVCDLLCAPAPAEAAAHCPSHEASAPAESNGEDGCEHDHGAGSVAPARVSDADHGLELAPALAVSGAARVARFRFASRAVALPGALDRPAAFSIPLRI